MPTYSYACTQCAHAFDIHQSFSDESLSVCPECEGRLRKVFSSVGVVFKGSGFYRNDARSGAKSSSVPAAPSGTGSAESSSTPSTGSSDSGSTAASTSPSTPAPASPATPAPAKAAASS